MAAWPVSDRNLFASTRCGWWKKVRRLRIFRVAFALRPMWLERRLRPQRNLLATAAVKPFAAQHTKVNMETINAADAAAVASDSDHRRFSWLLLCCTDARHHINAVQHKIHIFTDTPRASVCVLCSAQ